MPDQQPSGTKGIAAAVVVILLLGVGYFTYNKYKTSHTPPPEPAPEETQAAQPSPAMMTPDASASAQPGEQMTVTLLEQNRSRQAGIATITEMGAKTRVQIRLAGATGSAEPAHIHIGKCPTPGAVRYPLSDVVAGMSDTMIDVTFSQLKEMLPLAINVHKSKAEIQSYVACGDLQ